MTTGRGLSTRLGKLEILWRSPEPRLEVEHFVDDQGQRWTRVRFPGTAWRVISTEAWEAFV